MKRLFALALAAPFMLATVNADAQNTGNKNFRGEGSHSQRALGEHLHFAHPAETISMRVAVSHEHPADDPDPPAEVGDPTTDSSYDSGHTEPETSPPPAPPPADPSYAQPHGHAPDEQKTGFAREMGLMMGMGFGATGCTDRWCRDVKPMVGLNISGLFRFFPFAAAGLHMAFLFQHPKDKGGLDRLTSWSMIIGPEARGILPLDFLQKSLPKLDIWMSLVLGYERDGADGSGTVMGETITSKYWMHAFSLGWGFGADYFITDNIAAGLIFRLYKPWHTKVCSKSTGYSKTCSDVESEQRDNVGIHWWIGGSFMYFLPF